jgi:hypothetical protein
VAKRKKFSPKQSLNLPDRDQAKPAVLNSLPSIQRNPSADIGTPSLGKGIAAVGPTLAALSILLGSGSDLAP